MEQQAQTAAVTAAALPISEWSLRRDGHVIAGTLVVRDPVTVEVQIQLDGAVVYGSRHPNRQAAAEELHALRGRCEGWLQTI